VEEHCRVAQSRYSYYSRICLEGLSKTTKNLIEDSRCSNRNSNQAPHEYDCGMLQFSSPLNDSWPSPSSHSRFLVQSDSSITDAHASELKRLKRKHNLSTLQRCQWIQRSTPKWNAPRHERAFTFPFESCTKVIPKVSALLEGYRCITFLRNIPSSQRNLSGDAHVSWCHQKNIHRLLCLVVICKYTVSQTNFRSLNIWKSEHARSRLEPGWSKTHNFPSRSVSLLRATECGQLYLCKTRTSSDNLIISESAHIILITLAPPTSLLKKN
jgi:hypothetical protein